MSPSLDSATRLASQYGPFFFAVLFAFVILPRAVKLFVEVTRRRDLRTVDHWIFGTYFLLTFAVLVGLIYFASWWWSRHQPIYVVNGAIHKLNAVEVWSPNPMFFKKEYDPSIPGRAQTFDVNFLAYQEQKPFGKEPFEIRYPKPYDSALGVPDYISVSVPSDGSHYDFDATFNDKTRMNELVPRGTAPAKAQPKTTEWSLISARLCRAVSSDAQSGPAEADLDWGNPNAIHGNSPQGYGQRAAEHKGLYRQRDPGSRQSPPRFPSRSCSIPGI